MRKDGFNLVGLATMPIGLGEDLRMFAAMLDTLGIPYSVRALMDNSRPMREVRPNFLFNCEDRFEVSIFFVPPFSTLELRQAQPQLFAGQRLTIGYWPWELPHFPEEEIEALECTDMIWCPANFVRDSYRQLTGKPITVLPLPTALPPSSQRDFRKELGIPREDFVVLYAYDMASTAQRKNPVGTVRAFREFATPHDDAWLLLKCHRLKPGEASKFRETLNNDRIVVIDESMEMPDVAALYASADCYLSLHRSEGFGRTLVEALQAGLPLVTTNFSAPADFLTDESAWLVNWTPVEVTLKDFAHTPGSGSWWAEPDTQDAARQLERVYQTRSTTDRARLREAGLAFSVERLAAHYEPLFDACLQPHTVDELARKLESLHAGSSAQPARSDSSMGSSLPCASGLTATM